MSEQQKKYNLPKGWAWATIDELIDRRTGLFSDGDWIETKDQNPNGDVKLIQLADIGEGFIRNRSNRFMDKRTALYLNCTFLRQGDILVARMPEPIGRACIFPFQETEKYVTVVDVAIIRLGNSINNKLLTYLINSPEIRKQIEEHATGTTRKRISRKNLASIKIPIPPLIEQDRIVEKLEELFSSLEKSQEQLDSSLKRLKLYKQSLLEEIFNKNNSGKLVKLQNVLDFIGSGITPKGGKEVYTKTGIIFLRSQNVYPNRLELDNVAHIDSELHQNMSRTHVKPHDVLLNITGASIGRCAYIPTNFKEANVNQHVCILRPESDKVFYKYLSTYLNSPVAQRNIMKVQTGATRQGLNYSQIKNLEILVPELKVQKEMVAFFEEKKSICDKTEEALIQAMYDIDITKQKILSKAFKGKLVEQNSSNTPSAQLIEKIKQEKSKLLFQEKERKLNLPKLIKMEDKPKSILEVLKESTVPISSKQLWLLSDKKDDIDVFYTELKKLIEAGEIMEILPRKGKESFLKLADN